LGPETPAWVCCSPLAGWAHCSGRSSAGRSSATTGGGCSCAAYAFLPYAGSLTVAAICVVLAHAGGGAQWVLSTYGLQRTTPDAVRGRVMSLDFGLATLAIGLSALLAGGAVELVGLQATSWGLVMLAVVYGSSWLLWTRDLWQSQTDPLAPESPGSSDPLHPPR
jgi:predicted MFS family arabinose efflux permease